MYASLTTIADRDETFRAQIRDEESGPVLHLHTTFGPYLVLSMLEARNLSAAITAAFEEHERTEQGQHDAMPRKIGADT